MDLQKNIITNTTKDLVTQLENNLIEGLKLKGFIFDNKIELEDFVKSNCRCEDNRLLQEKTYFVNGIPFALWKYKIDFDMIDSDDETTMKFTMIYGEFKTL